MSLPNDCICPICLSILVEPVVMPCKHELCRSCFATYVEQTSLACPICRRRIASWARLSAKAGTLVDKERWAHIKKKFKKELQQRDAAPLEVSPVPQAVELAKPGEIYEEYLRELAKARAEAEEQRRLEAAASEALIQRMQQEDVLAATTGPPPAVSTRLSTSVCRRDSTVDGVQFLMVMPGDDCAQGRSTSADSLGPELNHFKPIHRYPLTPPRKGNKCDDRAKTVVVPKAARRLLRSDGASCSSAAAAAADMPAMAAGMPTMTAEQTGQGKHGCPRGLATGSAPAAEEAKRDVADCQPASARPCIFTAPCVDTALEGHCVSRNLRYSRSRVSTCRGTAKVKQQRLSDEAGSSSCSNSTTADQQSLTGSFGDSSSTSDEDVARLLQSMYDMEIKYGLNGIRMPGSGLEYALRPRVAQRRLLPQDTSEEPAAKAVCRK